MSWLDKFRKRKQVPLSDRDRKIAEISARVGDEDYAISDYLPDDIEAQLDEDRVEFGNDLEYPSRPVPRMDDEMDQEWLQKRLVEGKKQMKSTEQKKLEALKEKYPYPEVSHLNWDKPFAEVWGKPGVTYTQNGHFFTSQGKWIKYVKI